MYVCHRIPVQPILSAGELAEQTDNAEEGGVLKSGP